MSQRGASQSSKHVVPIRMKEGGERDRMWVLLRHVCVCVVAEADANALPWYCIIAKTFRCPVATARACLAQQASTLCSQSSAART